ncbi:MAG: hypothetical protein Q9193_006142, partial [Seirophora villosa]
LAPAAPVQARGVLAEAHHARGQHVGAHGVAFGGGAADEGLGPGGRHPREEVAAVDARVRALHGLHEAAFQLRAERRRDVGEAADGQAGVVEDEEPAPAHLGHGERRRVAVLALEDEDDGRVLGALFEAPVLVRGQERRLVVGVVVVLRVLLPAVHVLALGGGLFDEEVSDVLVANSPDPLSSVRDDVRLRLDVFRYVPDVFRVLVDILGRVFVPFLLILPRSQWRDLALRSPIQLPPPVRIPADC